MTYFEQTYDINGSTQISFVKSLKEVPFQLNTYIKDNLNNGKEVKMPVIIAVYVHNLSSSEKEYQSFR